MKNLITYIFLISILVGCKTENYNGELNKLKCLNSIQFDKIDLITIVPSNYCTDCIESYVNKIEKNRKKLKVLYVVVGNNIKEIDSIITIFSSTDFRIELHPQIKIPLVPTVYLNEGKFFTKISLNKKYDLDQILRKL